MGRERGDTYRSSLDIQVLLERQNQTLETLAGAISKLAPIPGPSGISGPAVSDPNIQLPGTSGTIETAPTSLSGKAKSAVSDRKLNPTGAGPNWTSSYYDRISDSDSDSYDSDDNMTAVTGDEMARDDQPTSKIRKLDNLFSSQDTYSAPINENLSKSVNRGISNTFSLKQGLEVGDKYKPPSNCEYLSVPKLNEELFFEDSINGVYKKNDSVLQKTQHLLTKGMIPLVQLMDKLLKQEIGDGEELFDLATDSLQLLAYTHRDISNVRRKFLKPAVAPKYKRLCASHIPLTSLLFGDDLDKQLKAINDSKRIGVQMTGETPRKRQYPGFSQNPAPQATSQSLRGKGPASKPFLFKARGGGAKYKRRGSFRNVQNRK
ncbi:MAG: hypothetical protein ABW185_01005 [Sedimenticola sp.]